MIARKNGEDIPTNSQSLYVVIHDVAPCFARQTCAILDALSPLVDTQIAAAVVPCWHGEPIKPGDADFITEVKQRCGDILLHGFHHFRANGGGLVSTITGGADEMNGLSIQETELLLERGQLVLQDHFDAAATGFIAPTFQRGKLTPELLARHGLDYAVGFRHIERGNGQRIPVATWCWDMGRWHSLGHMGHLYGNIRMRLYRDLLPTLAIHPVDIDRGFLPKIVDLTNRLLDEGRKPILFG